MCAQDVGWWQLQTWPKTSISAHTVARYSCIKIANKDKPSADSLRSETTASRVDGNAHRSKTFLPSEKKYYLMINDEIVKHIISKGCYTSRRFPFPRWSRCTLNSSLPCNCSRSHPSLALQLSMAGSCYCVHSRLGLLLTPPSSIKLSIIFMLSMRLILLYKDS